MNVYPVSAPYDNPATSKKVRKCSNYGPFFWFLPENSRRQMVANATDQVVETY